MQPSRLIPIALLAALSAAAPAHAGQERPRGVALVAQLQPLPGHSEHGVMHYAVRRKSVSIIGVLIGAKRPLDDYDLRLSRHTCGEFRAGARRPVFVGTNHNNLVGDWDGDGRDGVAILDGTSNTVLRVRGARSMVFTTGDDVDDIRACGKVNRIKLTDVLVSS
jgi:hypothetical protein